MIRHKDAGSPAKVIKKNTERRTAMQIEKLNLSKTAIGALKKNHITTTEDLAVFQPRAYHDYRKTGPIEDAVPGKYAAICAILLDCESKMGKRSYLQLRLVSQTGAQPYNVFLFSNVYLFSHYRTMVGEKIVLYGKVTDNPPFGKSIVPEQIIRFNDHVPHIEPVYRKIKGIPAEKLRSLIADATDMHPEILETSVREKFNLPSYKDTLRKIHAPATGREILCGQAELRLIDLVYFSLCFFKKTKNSEKGVKLRNWRLSEQFTASLPFAMTKDQQAFVAHFKKKAEDGLRNDVLLQGDVGSGKTAAAFACMAGAAGSGFQSVIMAPREALASQHYRKAALNFGKEHVVYLRSGMRAAERTAVLRDIKDGKVSYVVGTHSCISEDVIYHNLGLIVTDEEHLFGVKQKEALAEKAEKGVHRISLSATPIPRSLATVLYGDEKEIFAIRSMPAGRLPIKTCAIQNRRSVFSFISKQAAAGFGTYVICPAIDAVEETGLTNVEDMAAIYQAALPNLRCTAIHGRMKPSETQDAINAFANGDIDVLISTTVIEVGIDVPRATVIVIEQADRFGAATLHQLRGRVGRNDRQSYCILVTDAPDNPRVRAVCETTDGFKIAEADMALRGSGNLIGIEQAGMNRYVEEMLSDPAGFARARQIADYCSQNHYGQYLKDIYDTRSSN